MTAAAVLRQARPPKWWASVCGRRGQAARGRRRRSCWRCRPRLPEGSRWRVRCRGPRAPPANWAGRSSAAPLDPAEAARTCAAPHRACGGGRRRALRLGERPPAAAGERLVDTPGAVAPPPAVAEEPVPPPWPPGMAPAAAAPPAAPAAAAPAAAAAAAGAAADGAATTRRRAARRRTSPPPSLTRRLSKAQKVADEERPPLATSATRCRRRPRAPCRSSRPRPCRSAATEGGRRCLCHRVGAALHLISMLARIASALGTLQARCSRAS